MSTTARTDIHRPSAPEFDPEAYNCLGVFDMNPDWPNPAAAAYRIQLINRLIERGFRIGHGSSHQCGHCGAYIRYAALMVREDAKQYIYVGETCLDGRFEMTKGEFDTLRKQAQLDRERQRLLTAFTALADEHPALAYATYMDNIEIALESESRRLGREGKLAPVTDHRLANDDYFLDSRMSWGTATAADIARKTRKYGGASDKQLALVERIVGEQEAKWAAYLDSKTVQPDAAPKAELQVTGKRQLVEGTVVSRKDQENPFSYNGGTIWKILVEQADGTRVWGTEPSAFVTDKGDKVRFMAAVKVSDKDASFGFYSRPSQFEVVSA